MLIGITTGTCSTFLICAAVQYYYKWTVGFFVCGAMQMTWASIWLVVVNDSPEKHSFISKDEQSYLRDTIGSVFTIHVRKQFRLAHNLSFTLHSLRASRRSWRNKKGCKAHNACEENYQ